MIGLPLAMSRKKQELIDHSTENPDCPICEGRMFWHPLRDRDGYPAVLGMPPSRSQEPYVRVHVLICMDGNCPNGWYATQERVKYD